MIRELDCVALTKDLPTFGLHSGDVGTIVHDYGAAMMYEVEFLTLTGKTLAVVSLAASDVRPVDSGEIAHARSVSPVGGTIGLS